MTTITASTTLGIVLYPALDTNPVVIAAGVTISKNFGGYGGGYAVYNSYGAFTIQNDGVIIGLGSRLGFGVYLNAGGSVTNAAAASITGRNSGVEISGAAGTVVNDGNIASTDTGNNGVYLRAGGTVTNALSASITGYGQGVKIATTAGGAGGVVINDGAITGTGTSGYGVQLAAGASVTNAATGSIAGQRGIVLTGVGTAVNAGSITGTGNSGIGADLAGGSSLTNATGGAITGYTGVKFLGGGVVTNAIAASIAGSYTGVSLGGPEFAAAAATVVNAGTIAGGGIGAYLFSDGMVTNAASGLLTGGHYGAELLSTGDTVVNAGVISGTGPDGGGVRLFVGSLTNAESGTITGVDTGVLTLDSGTVDNAGTISGASSFRSGVYFGGRGSVSNAATGLITGAGIGVRLQTGGTLTNAGTIVGGNGVAVSFGGETVGNLLVLYPGFGFSGAVNGSMNASNTLELASAASAGTVAGLGSLFVDFGLIRFDPGAQWSIAGTASGFGEIIGFTTGDTIEVAGVTATGSSFNGGLLTLDESGGDATLVFAGSFSQANFRVTNVAGGADVTVACFAAGTRVLTIAGEVAVEALAPGSMVSTLSARQRPVQWVGRRRIDCRRHPHPDRVLPARIAAHAFGLGRPERDLFLSPDHAVFIDGVLIPVRCLLNGQTIVQERRAEVTYWHVELPAHDVILAEGLPCESYLDLGNRDAFDNGGVALRLHPDFAARIWQRDACAEQILGGPKLEAVRRRLSVQAALLKQARPGLCPGPAKGLRPLETHL